MTDAKMVITAMNFNSTKNPEEIGVGVFFVTEATENKTEKKVKLYSEDTGAVVGEVDLNIYIMR